MRKVNNQIWWSFASKFIWVFESVFAVGTWQRDNYTGMRHLELSSYTCYQPITFRMEENTFLPSLNKALAPHEAFSNNDDVNQLDETFIMHQSSRNRLMPSPFPPKLSGHVLKVHTGKILRWPIRSISVKLGIPLSSLGRHIYVRYLWTDCKLLTARQYCVIASGVCSWYALFRSKCFVHNSCTSF